MAKVAKKNLLKDGKKCQQLKNSKEVPKDGKSCQNWQKIPKVAKKMTKNAPKITKFVKR